MRSYIQPLFIRSDAWPEIGTGHVMRMIALGQAWQDRFSYRKKTTSNRGLLKRDIANDESGTSQSLVIIICAKLPDVLECRLRDEGFAVVRIVAKPGSEGDLRRTLAVVRDHGAGSRKQEAGVDEKQSSASSEANIQPGGRISHTSAVASAKEDIQRSEYPEDPPWLVVDGYHFGYSYQKGIKDRSGLRLLCVDDHGYSERWYCDAILNQNLDAEKRIDYQTELPGTTRLLGADYCLLRREFLQAQQPAKGWGRIQSLLVTLGGSDPENATGAVLQLLHQACPLPLDIRVLVGTDNPHLKSIQAFESHHRIEILQGVSNMTGQYAWADGIISAGGSTCWEWLYFGLPGAIVTIAENQLPIVNALTEMREAALRLGWVREFDHKKIAGILESWFDSPTLKVKQMTAHSLIDGLGGLRVVDFLSGRSSNQHAE